MSPAKLTDPCVHLTNNEARASGETAPGRLPDKVESRCGVLS